MIELGEFREVKMNSIKLKNVTKRLKGNTVLDDVTFTFESGNIYGLYGRNASGKTMLLRAIASLIYPNSGEIKIKEKILHKEQRDRKSVV